MKSVLISIKPRWCQLIASGKKTIEVRKTKPKLETPFKAYIYETKGKLRFCDTCVDNNCEKWHGEGLSCYEGKGKVIGEFICNDIWPMSVFRGDRDLNGYEPKEFPPGSCLTDKEIIEYLGNGVTGYGLFIKNLKIYDKPKELGKFIVPSKIGCVNEGKCKGCAFFDKGNEYNVEDDCNAPFCTDDYKPLTRPPQSWCYVEEM